MKDIIKVVLGGLGLVGAAIAAGLLGVPDTSTSLTVPPHPREEQIRKLVRGHGRIRDSATVLRVMMGSFTAGVFVVGLFYHPALLAALAGYILTRHWGKESSASRERISALLGEADRLRTLRRDGIDQARRMATGPLGRVAESAIRLYALPPRMPPATDLIFRGRVLEQLDIWIERLDPVARARASFDAALAAGPAAASRTGPAREQATSALSLELARAKSAGDERRVQELKARLDALEDIEAARTRAAERSRAIDDTCATLASQLDGIGPQLLANAGADLVGGIERALAAAENSVVRLEELAGLGPKDVAGARQLTA